MTIDLNPEFGYELVCAAPYAYWLKEQGEYVKVITSKGMKPFYWFCDEVEEKYTNRSVDNNNNGVQNLPNNWIHHNALANFSKDYSLLTEEEKKVANGWLDYSKWIAPPYAQKYKKEGVPTLRNYVIISNRFNLEHGQVPIGYFDIESLYTMFNLLTEKGYNIIYKRPRNTEFTTDPNELQNQDITANVEGQGMITDYELTNYFENVYLFDDIVKLVGGTYNEAQLAIYSSAEGFISMGGGSSILCSYFNKPVIIYVNTSKDIRPGYFEGESYFNKLSKAKVVPVVDTRDNIIARGYRDYSKVYLSIQEHL
jgi:hypothetical protein